MVLEINHCYNCNFTGQMTHYWLVTNEENNKAYATYELEPDDIYPDDKLIEVECCPRCGADQ